MGARVTIGFVSKIFLTNRAPIKHQNAAYVTTWAPERNYGRTREFLFHQLKRFCRKRVPSENKLGGHANENAPTRTIGPISDRLCRTCEAK